MIEIVGHDEPSVHELDSDSAYTFGVQSLKWFVAAVVLQILVIVGLIGYKACSTVPGKLLTIPVLRYNSASFDKFRGYYITELVYQAEFETKQKIRYGEIFAVFKNNGTSWELDRIEKAMPVVSDNEISLKGRAYYTSPKSKILRITFSTDCMFVGEPASGPPANAAPVIADLRVTTDHVTITRLAM